MNWFFAIVSVFYGVMAFGTSLLLSREAAKVSNDRVVTTISATLGGIFWPVTMLCGIFNSLPSK